MYTPTSGYCECNLCPCCGKPKRPYSGYWQYNTPQTACEATEPIGTEQFRQVYKDQNNY